MRRSSRCPRSASPPDARPRPHHPPPPDATRRRRSFPRARSRRSGSGVAVRSRGRPGGVPPSSTGSTPPPSRTPTTLGRRGRGPGAPRQTRRLRRDPAGGAHHARRARLRAPHPAARRPPRLVGLLLPKPVNPIFPALAEMPGGGLVQRPQPGGTGPAPGSAGPLGSGRGRTEARRRRPDPGRQPPPQAPRPPPAPPPAST
jgi:hypothetical protein